MPQKMISISSKLKERIDAVEARVNWSAIAAEAFEKHLNTLQIHSGEYDMSNVIARLKVSKAEFESGDYEIGYEAGEEWAATCATYEELKNISPMTVDDEDRFDKRWIAGEISPELTESEFWEEVAGDDWQKISDTWIRGFIDGAKGLFEKVQDQL